MVAAGAHGATVAVPLTATLGPWLGSRSVSLVTPGRIVSDLGGEPAPLPLTIMVSETDVAGDAGGWSVTVQASDFVDDAGDRVGAGALVDQGNTLAQTGGGGTAVAAANPGPMDQPETVLADQGQDPSRLYTGTYTASSQLYLAPPNGTLSGVYTSILTVTLLS